MVVVKDNAIRDPNVAMYKVNLATFMQTCLASGGRFENRHFSA
jgi:hypothetical protein